MGAESFTAIGKGKTVKEAFRAAVDAAQYEYGHSGYTGTIAEKSSYVVMGNGIVDADAALILADEMIRNGDSRIDDKWGPAGAIQVAADEWLFFGWASS